MDWRISESFGVVVCFTWRHHSLPPKKSSNIKCKGSLADDVDPFNSDALHPMVFSRPKDSQKSSGKFLEGIRKL